MSMKKYDVTIYGRANTIWIGIKGKKLYNEIVISNNKDNAKKEALNNFYMFVNDMWKEVLLDKRNIKIECELVSWLIHDNKEMIYINEILK